MELSTLQSIHQFKMKQVLIFVIFITYSTLKANLDFERINLLK